MRTPRDYSQMCLRSTTLKNKINSENSGYRFCQNRIDKIDKIINDLMIKRKEQRRLYEQSETHKMLQATKGKDGFSILMQTTT